MPPPLHLVEHYPIIYDHAKTKRAVFCTTQSYKLVMKFKMRAGIEPARERSPDMSQTYATPSALTSLHTASTIPPPHRIIGAGRNRTCTEDSRQTPPTPSPRRLK